MKSPVSRALVAVGCLLPLAAGCHSRTPAAIRDASEPKDTATDQSIFATWWSNTALAVPANDLMGSSLKETVTYRSYARPHAPGAARWRFWTSNATDSTYNSGPANPNRLGGSWRIESAFVGDGGTTATGAVEPGTMQPVLFDGTKARDVQSGERFWSDPVDITIPGGHLLAFTWSVSTFGVISLVPFAHAPIVSSFRANGAAAAGQESATGFSSAGDQLVAPQTFATETPVTARRLCFLGDSITQGIGSSKDSYGYWVAKIATALGPEVAVWDLGNGWARASDAATDGYWLYKAKQCDEVAIALGVNDLNVNASPVAADIVANLTTIVAALRTHRQDVRIILFTVPPFGYTGAKYDVWKTVNTAIRTDDVQGVDRMFDMAAPLSRPAPDDGLVKVEYMNGGDSHPNDAGSTVIADAFVTWYRAP